MRKLLYFAAHIFYTMEYLPKIANYFIDCYYCNHICKYISDKKTTYPSKLISIDVL